MKHLNLNNIEKMLTMQDSMNTTVNNHWRNENNPWYRAMWTECAELMDHIGWKWWSKQELDINQAEMELVDIWHFGLSDILQKGVESIAILKDVESIYQNTLKHERNEIDKKEVLKNVENFSESILIKKTFDIKSFFVLANSLNLDFDRLTLLYIAKNVLNKFRQNNGYKSGTYTKIWGGKEDNCHLTQIVLDFNDNNLDTLEEYIYKNLEIKYKSVKSSIC
ncbi:MULTISPECIES: dUTP diphosphatase [Moraxella]|nr:dUTP diphosphatase [Moraxella osloensis]